jgi:hypothetical protein
MTRTCRRVLVGFSAVAAAALTPATASGVAPTRPCPENFPDAVTHALKPWRSTEPCSSTERLDADNAVTVLIHAPTRTASS